MKNQSCFNLDCDRLMEIIAAHLFSTQHFTDYPPEPPAGKLLEKKQPRRPKCGSVPQSIFAPTKGGEEITAILNKTWPGVQFEIMNWDEADDSNCRHALIFTPQGWDECAAITHWGQEHPLNREEQRFRCLGPTRLTDGKHRFSIVNFCQAIPTRRDAYSADASTLDNENDDLERFGKYGRDCNPFFDKYGPCTVTTAMGHTHPGPLGVFMSQDDIQAHRCASMHEGHTTLILNPQKKIIRAWTGPNREKTAVLRCVMP